MTIVLLIVLLSAGFAAVYSKRSATSTAPVGLPTLSLWETASATLNVVVEASKASYTAISSVLMEVCADCVHAPLAQQRRLSVSSV